MTVAAKDGAAKKREIRNNLIMRRPVSVLSKIVLGRQNLGETDWEYFAGQLRCKYSSGGDAGLRSELRG